jgi:hypothetical protein
MRRTLVAVFLVAAGIVMVRAGLIACGDKSLAPGGIRNMRAANRPASILIYGQAGSRIAAAARELKLQETLQRNGYAHRDATTSDELDAALASGQLDVIMADVADVPALQQRVASMPSRPTVVAVAYRLTKAEGAAAKNERFLVKVPSLEVEYLDTITKAIRTKNTKPRKT